MFCTGGEHPTANGSSEQSGKRGFECDQSGFGEGDVFLIHEIGLRKGQLIHIFHRAARAEDKSSPFGGPEKVLCYDSGVVKWIYWMVKVVWRSECPGSSVPGQVYA